MRSLDGSEPPLAAETFCFVSCDIAGHGLARNVDVQAERVRKLNEVVHQTLVEVPGTIWASGGDGGHVAFPIERGPSSMVDLIGRLHGWSQEDQVPLRITAHVGVASSVIGADNRVQLVGEGINLCGSLLDFGSPHSVVVSDAFRRFIESTDLEGVAFREERAVYLKHFLAERLYLFDLQAAKLKSTWGEPAKSEQQLMREALDSNLPWPAIYHAKRLLQSSSDDHAARQAIEKAAQITTELTMASHSATAELVQLVRLMDTETLTQLLQTADLVERDNGQHLCFKGDDADTMFIVLSGEVGVVVEPVSEGGGAQVAPPHDHRFKPGSIAGELAFVLRCNRTATLQAIGRVAVLAISYRRLEEVLRSAGASSETRRQSIRIFDEKTLEYICNHASYLIGPQKRGPIDHDSHPWQHMRGGHSQIWHIENCRGRVLRGSDKLFSKDGIYVLVSGVVRRFPENNEDERVIRGASLRLLWVDRPGEFVHTHNQYKCLSNHVVIVRIACKALNAIEARCTREHCLTEAFKSELARHRQYHVFLAYDFNDAEREADVWQRALAAQKLRVYRNKPVPGEDYPPAIQAALTDSAVFVPLISRRVAENSGSGVRKEVEWRMGLFRSGKPNVLPIILPGSPSNDRSAKRQRAEDVVPTITPIVVNQGDLAGALTKAVARIQAIIAEETPVPYANIRAKRAKTAS